MKGKQIMHVTGNLVAQPYFFLREFSLRYKSCLQAFDETAIFSVHPNVEILLLKRDLFLSPSLRNKTKVETVDKHDCEEKIIIVIFIKEQRIIGGGDTNIVLKWKIK